ncbi:Protein kinase domain - like 10 [Theobroma cacao]|nr:Protein kinase domain - like 10 [Theobroma cacao]
MSFKDIVIGSQMSVHKNVLQLLGCCLETTHITIWTTTSTTTMEMQVENCNGLANAVAYLHTALSRPFIHPDIRSLNTILDQDNVPKLIDFSLSNSIHEGQSHVEGIVGVGGGWGGGVGCGLGGICGGVASVNLCT